MENVSAVAVAFLIPVLAGLIVIAASTRVPVIARHPLGAGAVLFAVLLVLVPLLTPGGQNWTAAVGWLVSVPVSWGVYRVIRRRAATPLSVS
jgi:hypothetical protein